jgi:hypothetical protein
MNISGGLLASKARLSRLWADVLGAHSPIPVTAHPPALTATASR